MNWEQQRQQILATIKSKRTEMGQIITKASTDGRTVNDDEEVQVKALEDEITKLEINLKRVEGFIESEKKSLENTTPIEGQTAEQAHASAEGRQVPRVEVNENLEPGIGFSLMVKASAVAAKAKGGVSTLDILKSWGAPAQVQNAVVQKATIGTTTDANFASSLVDYSNLTSEFIELVRQKTVVDKLAPKMRNVPFNVNLPAQISPSSVGWVGEAKRIQASNPEFGDVKLSNSKISGLVILSDELLRFSNPKADALVKDDLVDTTAQFIDAEFFDPTKSETEKSPASITNGLTPINNTGVEASNYDADLNSLISQVTDAGLSLEGAYFIMGETRATQMAGLRDSLGRKYFDGMELVGTRSLKGLPVLTTGSMTDKIAIVIPSQILLADDGVVDFSVSTEATINIGTDEAPEFINLYERELSAIRSTRFIRWKKRRAAAAGYIKY